ncbi:MAG: Holliday junction branch migration protein RuvA [Patescibacteria group bacterium]
MIGSLRGTVCGHIRGQVLIDVGGVGYRVGVTADSLTSLVEGQEVLLWTHMAVRETAQDLYGFRTQEELLWFEMLLTVSGVGPKSALAIMSAVDTATLESAIARRDLSALAAPGVGKKTAEKIVLELREKVGSIESVGPGSSDVVDALVGLGYSQKEARDVARSLPPSLASTEDRIREAIRIASRA